MEAILELLLKNELEVQNVICWLASTTQIPLLDELGIHKNEFVPSFLDFIRNQGSSFIQAANNSGLSPCKSTHKLKVNKFTTPIKASGRNSSAKSSCSKAKTLDFSKTSHVPQNDFMDGVTDTLSPLQKDVLTSTDSISFNRFYFKTPIKDSPQFSLLSLNDSPVSSLHSSKEYSTSTPRFKVNTLNKFSDGIIDSEFHQSNSVKKSERKNILGDYIVMDSSKNSTKKKLSKDTRNSSSKNERERIKTVLHFNINDNTAFPPMGWKPPKINQAKRRIKPTLMSAEERDSCFDSLNHSVESNVFLMASETKVKSLEEERKLLKEQKEKLFKTPQGKKEGLRTPQSTPKSSNVFMSPDDSYSFHSFPNNNVDTPCISKVTFPDKLNVIAQLYSSLILSNMTPNIMLEFYFLMQLITVKDNENSLQNIFEEFSLIDSIHNCVYFSVKSLSFLFDYIILFDKSLAKSLSGNIRIKNFDADFYTKLTEYIETSSSLKVDFSSQPKSPILSVSFQSETDNRNNFPNASAFQIFKKQRDLFYETLRIWEDNHLLPDWSFSQGLSAKIKQIFTLQSDPTNMIHLARLFQSQLLTMCKGDEQVNASKDAEDISLLCQLKKQNPEKFQRLFERLVTPSKFGGPVPPPSFPGSQEYFKNFILVALCHNFNVHLRNTLVAKIIELNEMSCHAMDFEEKYEHCEHVKNEIASSVQSLRLLAKYLGYLEFLPYQNTDHLSDVVISCQLVLRNKVCSTIPLHRVLEEAILSGCLVIVIPWMVELFSMVDSVAFHTRYYLTLIFGLVLIYKRMYLFRVKNTRSGLCKNCSQQRPVTPANSLFLKFLIGWLLSLPNVPEGLFYLSEDEIDIDKKEYDRIKQLLNARYAERCEKCLKNTLCWHGNGNLEAFVSPLKPCIGRNSVMTPHKIGFTKTPSKNKEDISPLKTPSKFLQMSMIETPEVTPVKPNEDNFIANDVVLDSSDFVDYSIMLLCCPFIQELKGILNDFALGNARASAGGTVRKITPLTALDKSNEVTPKSIQLLLEENFFHNQPSSTKKTVDFVMERIFSNVLRSIRSEIIPQFKDECVCKLKLCVSEILVTSPSEKFLEILDNKVSRMSSELSAQVKRKVESRLKVVLEKESIMPNLVFLLPCEVTEVSLEMCCKIVNRTVKERINSWASSHLTPGFCVKELATEAHKYFKQSQKSFTSESALSAGLHGSNLPNNSSTLGNSNKINKELKVTGNEEQLKEISTNITSPQSLPVIVPAVESQKNENPLNVQEHNEDLSFPSTLLSDLKAEIRGILLYSTIERQNPTADDVSNRLNYIRQCLMQRQDATLPIYKALETLTADWMVVLCLHHPNVVDKELLISFCGLWAPATEKGLFPNPSVLDVFLSPRTFTMTETLPEISKKSSWSKLKEVMIQLLLKRLVTPSNMQQKFIALLKYEWQQTTLTEISNLIESIVDDLKIHKNLGEDSEVVEFLEWVGWFTSQMNDLDELQF